MSSSPPKSSPLGIPSAGQSIRGRKPIGRPRLFDEAQVLEAALQVFWHYGYEGTTLAHLTKATGLHKGSLYQAFGDKKSIFTKVLRHYLDVTYNEVTGGLDRSAEPIRQLRELLHRIINFKAAAEGENTGSCGCLVINTMVEKAPHDSDIQAVLEAGYARRVNTLSDIIHAAQQCGQVNNKLPAAQLAEMICTMISGLAATIKGPLNDEQAHRLVDDFLTLLQ